MKGVARCILGLLLLHVPAIQNTIFNKKPTYEELLLEVERLSEKLDAHISIMRSIKLNCNAKMSAQEVTLANAIAFQEEFMKNATSTWNTKLSNAITTWDKKSSSQKQLLHTTASTWNSNLKSAISNWNSNLEKSKAQWKDGRQAAAFLAVRLTDTTVNNGDKVVFSLVSYDNLNGYNRITGTYKCPYNGTYMFYVTITGYSFSALEYKIAIQKEGSTLTYAHSHLQRRSPGYSNYYESMSAMAVTKCTKGQSVYVRNESGGTRYVYKLAHFTGFKIA